MVSGIAEQIFWIGDTVFLSRMQNIYHLMNEKANKQLLINNMIWNTKIAVLETRENSNHAKDWSLIEYVCVHNEAVFIKRQDPVLTVSNRSVTVQHST